jgi:hypothetical protein
MSLPGVFKKPLVPLIVSQAKKRGCKPKLSNTELEQRAQIADDVILEISQSQAKKAKKTLKLLASPSETVSTNPVNFVEPKTRKALALILNFSQLQPETQAALMEEDERLNRLRKSKKVNIIKFNLI